MSETPWTRLAKSLEIPVPPVFTGSFDVTNWMAAVDLETAQIVHDMTEDLDG